MTQGPSAEEARKIVGNKLYTVPEGLFDEEKLDKISVLINLSDDPDLVSDTDNLLYVFWSTDENVDMGMFEGLIRLCSSAMRGKLKRVLLVGNQDTIDTVAACILREYLGCTSDTAIAIMRDGGRRSLNKSGLIETVNGYKPS